MPFDFFFQFSNANEQSLFQGCYTQADKFNPIFGWNKFISSFTGHRGMAFILNSYYGNINNGVKAGVG